MDNITRRLVKTPGDAGSHSRASYLPPREAPGEAGRFSLPTPGTPRSPNASRPPSAPRPPVAPKSPSHIENDLTSLKAAGEAVHRIRLSAQQELGLARQLRAEAERYQQETETRARSQAQQLVLKARLETQKDIEELIRKASAEIQKVLADIRVIRITAQEELETQRKFTSVARIKALSLALQVEPEKPAGKKKETVKV